MSEPVSHRRVLAGSAGKSALAGGRAAPVGLASFGPCARIRSGGIDELQRLADRSPTAARIDNLKRLASARVDRPVAAMPPQAVDLPGNAHPAAVRHAGTLQLKPMDKIVTGITHLVELVDGHLYDKDHRANEREHLSDGAHVTIDTDARIRSRRGPNQEEFAETDRTAPPLYLWYLVTAIGGSPAAANLYVREDTITHPSQAALLNAPLQNTVYGTDKATHEEIRDAYRQGFRDFDCAFSYHGGSTFEMFRRADIDPMAPARIVYKFKLAEAEGAATELAKLTRTPGVMLYAVMLHEFPEKPDEIERALDHLALFSATYHCRVGVSNVQVTGAGDPGELPKLREALRARGAEISVVENKMNPAVPDRAVRDYCHREGLQYLAYGLSGPSTAGGTCGVVPGSGDGDYQLLSDPGLIALAGRLDISPDDLRQVIFTWARRKSVKVIARSSQPDRRLKAGTDFTAVPKDVDIDATLDDYGSENPSSGIYAPLHEYLVERGVAGDVLAALTRFIPERWLESYYKSAVVKEHDFGLAQALTSPHWRHIVGAVDVSQWKNVGQMKDFFASPPLPQVAAEAAPGYPRNPSTEVLAAYIENEAGPVSLYNIGTMDQLGAGDLAAQGAIAVAIISQGGDPPLKYTHDGNGTWTGPLPYA